MSSHDPHIGRTFLGRYRVIERLARGGMGVIYLGRAEGAGGFRRPVVIKLISPEVGATREVTGMFLREAKVLATLQHPNVVSIVDFGHEADLHVMVLEYVRGYSLGLWSRLLRHEQRDAPVSEACFIVEELLVALTHVHGLRRQGEVGPVVHRDISPSNVLLALGGHVKLLDFGIAKGQTPSEDYETTDDQSVKGKFSYMAPELFRSRPATPQSDLYACGVVLRELLRGRNDFRGRDLSETVQHAMKLQPEPLRNEREDVPTQLDEFLARAHAKRPSARFADADEMLAALRALRTVPAEDVRARLEARLARDFERLPQALQQSSLDEREAAWRDRDFAAPEPRAEPAGTPSEPATDPRVEPPSGASTRSRYALATLVVVLLGALTWFAARASTREEPAVVVVDSRQDLPRDLEPDEERVEALEVSGQVGTIPEDRAHSDPSAAPPTSATPGSGLRAALARQQAGLRVCFERHAEPADPAEVILRAHIARDGHVDRAEILDPNVRRSALGGCLIAAAHDLTFPPRATPVSFRIPLRAR